MKYSVARRDEMENLTKKISENLKSKPSAHFDFGVVDYKNRKIGAIISYGEAEFVPVTDDSGCGYRMEAGHYFTYCPHNTRNGQSYGSCNPTKYYKTEAERDAAVAQYLKAAVKRYKGTLQEVK